MQVEDAKDFIKTRILSLIDQKQTPHKVGAAIALQAYTQICLRNLASLSRTFH